MWITGDQGERGTGERIGSVQGDPKKSRISDAGYEGDWARADMAEGRANSVIDESGERRWREA